jgi:hypothetical protein
MAPSPGVNRAAAGRELGWRYPFLNGSTLIENLPLPVLQWVIDEEAGLHE